MKYKIGDIVKVKDNLQVDEIYGECYVVECMLKFRGTLDIIESIDKNGDYHLANNNNPYTWSEGMLELIVTKDDLSDEDTVETKNNMKYKVGDVVRIKDNLQVGEKYGMCRVIYDMLKFKGTVDTINFIDRDGDYHLTYNNPYAWNGNMLDFVESKNDEKIKEENDMKYKIGDVVRIKNNLQVGEKYGQCNVIKDMLKFKGTLDTIEKIDDDGDFYLADDNNPYSWNKDMVEPIKQTILTSDLKSVKMDRLGIYEYILNNLEETYRAKNNDYGNSVADTYDKFGCVSFLVRITDEYNKLMTLCNPNAPEQRVKDEKIDDTILDLANYCLLWLVEREYKNQ